MNSKRQSNFELLRILSILFIISFHYVYKGGFVYEALSINKMIINIFTMIGEVGVNLFILISGYFLIKSTKEINIKKVILLIIEMFFYNIINLFIVNNFNLVHVFHNLTYSDIFLFIDNRYWFATAYILLYIFSPYINRLILSLSFKENIKFIITLLIIYCIIPTLFGMRINNTETLLYYNRFIWLVVVYISGAFIRLHGKSIKIFSKTIGYYFMMTIFCSLMVIIMVLFMEIYKDIFMKIGISHSTYFWRPNTIVTYVWSVLIFLTFRSLKFQNHLVNVMASTTFGIYLLHDGVANPILWNQIFKNATHAHSHYLLIHILLATLIIFILGFFIELLRQRIEKFLFFVYYHFFKGSDKFEKIP